VYLYDAAGEQAKGFCTYEDYTRAKSFAALETYLSASIDDALQSGNTIIKALAPKQSFDLLGFS
jgi:hypothetical protein